MTQLKDVIWNPSGFEDLKKYSSKNNDFLRDASAIFFERAKLEQVYAEGLQKLATKARKICGDAIGTLRKSWEEIASQTDAEANLHKTLSSDIIEEITKPLKSFAENQKEARKVAEHMVDKSAKQLTEKRSKEQQAKKQAFSKAKESETYTVQLETSRGKAISDKELTKLDSKCKKAEESVEKSDKDYITKLVDGERARLDLDSSIQTATDTLEQLEDERISYFRSTLTNFTNFFTSVMPKKDECYKTMDYNIQNINPGADIQVLVEQRGTPRQPCEQLLFASYEEDLSNPMDHGRRKSALERKREKLARIIQGERKAKTGLTRLNSVYQDTPSFSTKESQQDVGFKLEHSQAVIDMLDASIYRINVALAQLDSYNPPEHPLAPHITERKDKQGIVICYLRIPIGSFIPRDENEDESLYTAAMPADYNNSTYGRLSSGGDGDFDDEFDDIDPEFEEHVDSVNTTGGQGYSAIDQCQADYDYEATEKDELSIRIGDVINVTLRHDDGWWKGELNGKTGLFPESYVHQL
ncbi:nostrin-like isoform X2 [Clytia hemisphaerica]|uniref:Nostrin n=1 Tax=Clytia hemisphaerica TaxID=252671 RepID=A0A7M5UFS3_9CNID